MCIVFASIFAGSYYAAPLQGIAVGMLAAAITNYYIMILTLRNKVFPDDWKKLLLRPFLNGIPLTIYLVIPSFLIYLLCLFVTHNDDVISFLITCSIVGGFLAYCFFKKPKLLGKGFCADTNDTDGNYEQEKTGRKETQNRRTGTGNGASRIT